MPKDEEKKGQKETDRRLPEDSNSEIEVAMQVRSEPVLAEDGAKQRVEQRLAKSEKRRIDELQRMEELEKQKIEECMEERNRIIAERNNLIAQRNMILERSKMIADYGIDAITHINELEKRWRAEYAEINLRMDEHFSRMVGYEGEARRLKEKQERLVANKSKREKAKPPTREYPKQRGSFFADGQIVFRRREEAQMNRKREKTKLLTPEYPKRRSSFSMQEHSDEHDQIHASRREETHMARERRAVNQRERDEREERQVTKEFALEHTKPQMPEDPERPGHWMVRADFDQWSPSHLPVEVQMAREREVTERELNEQEGRQATKQPEREKAKPLTREHPKRRRNSMTLAEIVEQNRLRPHEEVQMAREREAIERERDEQAATWRQQQQMNDYWGHFPGARYAASNTSTGIDHRGSESSHRLSRSGHTSLMMNVLGRSNSPRRVSIIQPVPPASLTLIRGIDDGMIHMNSQEDKLKLEEVVMDDTYPKVPYNGLEYLFSAASQTSLTSATSTLSRDTGYPKADIETATANLIDFRIR